MEALFIYGCIEKNFQRKNRKKRRMGIFKNSPSTL